MVSDRPKWERAVRRVYRIVLRESEVKDEFLLLASSFEGASTLARSRSMFSDAELESVIELGTLRDEE